MNQLARGPQEAVTSRPDADPPRARRLQRSWARPGRGASLRAGRRPHEQVLFKQRVPSSLLPVLLLQGADFTWSSCGERRSVDASFPNLEALDCGFSHRSLVQFDAVRIVDQAFNSLPLLLLLMFSFLARLALSSPSFPLSFAPFLLLLLSQSG